MAARAPTSFNQYNDESTLAPRRQILTTVPNAVLNDQQFVLDVKNVLITDVFYPVSTTSGSYVVAARYPYRGIDMCAGNATDTHQWAVYAWASDSTTTFTVQALIATYGTSDTIAVAASTDSKIWRGWSNTLALDSSGRIDTLKIQMKRDSGSGTVYVGGVCVFQDWS